MILSLLLALSSPCLAVDSFSFIHTSDQHVPYGDTEAVMLEMKDLGEAEMAPYGITAPQPSFVISTGDLTEFGGGSGWWEDWLGVMDQVGLPYYMAAGNHDNTWESMRPRITKLRGSPYYSFEYGGVHFVGLDSASPQDPRPCFGREELLWLARDLARIDPATPVILFFHHPPNGGFASPYDVHRLYDILRPYNVLVMLDGHGHGIIHQEAGGFDLVMGGSTFGDNAGFAICDIRDGRLRIAYRMSGQSAADIPVLDKPIAEGSSYPRIEIESPAQGEVVSGTVRFEGTVEGDLTAAQVILDDDTVFPLRLADGRFAGDVELTSNLAGPHWYRVGLRGPGGETAWRASDLFVDTNPDVKVDWRTMLGGSSRSTPLAIGDLVVLGADDGCVYALDRDTGDVRWRVETGGDVLGGPIVVPLGAGPRMGLMDRAAIFAGSGDGKLYSISLDGELIGTFDAGAPIASSPAALGGSVVVATTDGTVHRIDADTLDEMWRNDSAEYAIEDTLFVTDDAVYFGAWDTYVYALSAETGELLWRSAASGTLEGGAKRYYSPADCGPVVCGDRLYAADRKYHLSVMSIVTGEMLDSRQGVSGVGLSEDGASVYLRTTKAGVVKLNGEGTEVWSADVPTGSIATIPVERDGTVYSVSDKGTLAAIDAASGAVRWQIGTLPGFFAMSDPCADGGTVYVSGMDGSVTAIRPR